VVVSCVTKDPPFRAHPHSLVGKEGCKRGICTVSIKEETMTASFCNLGIQCVKKKDIEEALKIREEIRVDPFRSKYPSCHCYQLWFLHMYFQSVSSNTRMSLLLVA
jgi:Rel/ankyrin family protein